MQKYKCTKKTKIQKKGEVHLRGKPALLLWRQGRGGRGARLSGITWVGLHLFHLTIMQKYTSTKIRGGPGSLASPLGTSYHLTTSKLISLKLNLTCARYPQFYLGGRECVWSLVADQVCSIYYPAINDLMPRAKNDNLIHQLTDQMLVKCPPDCLSINSLTDQLLTSSQGPNCASYAWRPQPEENRH